jgi:hypothetical protein
MRPAAAVAVSVARKRRRFGVFMAVSLSFTHATPFRLACAKTYNHKPLVRLA